MKLAISNIAWNQNDEYYYKLMQKNGFTGLEIVPNKFCPYNHNCLKGSLTEKQKILDKYNLSVVAMQSLLFGTEKLTLFSGQKNRAALKKYLKTAIIYANTIQCPVLIFGSPKNRIMQNPLLDHIVAVDFFKELGDFAKQNNTCLCIEPNPKEYGTNFITTIKEACQLVNDVGSLGFGMIIDTGTMLINNDQPQLALKVLAHTKHIHICMPFLKSFNQEFENWIKRFLILIKNSDYDKFISIEMLNASKNDIKKFTHLLSCYALE